MAKMGFLDALGIKSKEAEAVLDQIQEQVQSEERSGSVEETLARRVGWKPQDQWDRDPTKWKPASEFVSGIPDQIEHLHKTNASLKDQLRRQASASAEMIEQTRREAREAAKRELNQAIEAGDADRAKQAAAAMENTIVPPVVTDWLSRNSWYHTDPVARAAATVLSADLAKKGYSTNDELAEVERQIKQRFPEHFNDGEEVEGNSRQSEPRQERGTMTLTQAAQRNPPQVSGGSRVAAPRPRGAPTFADIPNHVRKVYKQTLARQGITEEQYAKAYWSDEDNTDQDDD